MSSERKDGSFLERFSKKHISDAARLERDVFSEPWSEKAMELLCTDDYPSFVLCGERGELLGYVSTSKVLDELQIINLAVRAESRRNGYGKALMQRLDEFCLEGGILSISLEVRASNEAAIALYESVGYQIEGQRKNFYRYPTEDAKIMVKRFDK